MVKVSNNISAQEILKSNIENTKAQIKSVNQCADSLNNPQLTKYLQSVGKAMQNAEDLDKAVLNKCSMIDEPVKKGLLSKLKGLIKSLL